jgi:cephalosporin hydroxylase
MSDRISRWRRIVGGVGRVPIVGAMAALLKQRSAALSNERGYASMLTSRTIATDAAVQLPNRLRSFFENRTEGHGIWKWTHYFDIYDRHFRAFRGRDVHVLEIGIYSGGSLDMWRDYFGPKATIYGVDIEPDCRVYEKDGVKIHIGDQADRSFWNEFRRKVPRLDIVIDDGGHEPEQQIVTLEELLPLLNPGGIYLCEDVHGSRNEFAAYAQGLAHKLNDFDPSEFPDDADRRIVCKCTPFQSTVSSVHFYPFVTVVEKNSSPVAEMKAPKRGTQWQPFLK